MKLIIDTAAGDQYLANNDTRKQLWARIHPLAVDGYNEAAKALGIPRQQLLNLIGYALHEAIVTNDTIQ